MIDLIVIRQFIIDSNRNWIACETGIHRNTLYNIATGKHTPNYATLEKIQELKEKGTLAEDAK